jgi:hypothetical protein
MVMKFKYSLVLLLLVVTLILPYTIVPVAAQEQNWIHVVRVIDVNSRVDFTNKSLLAGGIYNFTFTVNVPFDAADTLNLDTQLVANQSQYWFLSGQYKGIDTTQWTPGSSHITFSQMKGVATFSLVGKIPLSVTTRQAVAGNLFVVLHFTNTSYPAAVLTVSSSRAVVGSFTVTVVDQAISAYESELQTKQQLAKTPGIESTYGSFLNSMIGQANQLYGSGFVEEGLRLLKSIPNVVTMETPPPAESPLPMILTVVIVAIALVAALTGFLAIRARGKLTLLKSMIEDEANKLDLSMVKLQRTDQSLASEIGQVKEKLRELGG